MKIINVAVAFLFSASTFTLAFCQASANSNANSQFPAAPDGLWIPPCGAWLGAECTNSSPRAFNNFERQIGRRLDVLRIYHKSGEWTALTPKELNYIHDGYKLLLSVKPAARWRDAVGVANGGSARVDEQMASLAKSIAAIKPQKVMLIVWHEPQHEVVGSVPKARAGTAAQYVQMWHNVRNIFDANGATNVIWCWDVQGYVRLRYLLPSLWPGDRYVDWVMWDEYQSSARDPFTNVLQGTYHWMTAHSDAAHDYLSKPWGLAEWGVGIHRYHPTVADQSKAINSLNDALNKYHQFPRLKLLAYFDNNDAPGGASAILPEAMPVYSNFAHSPYMTRQISR